MREVRAVAMVELSPTPERAHTVPGANGLLRQIPRWRSLAGGRLDERLRDAGADAGRSTA